MDFTIAFEKITGHKPFPWQHSLYNTFQSGVFPDVANIPTSFGKTNTLIVWLLALAWHIQQRGNKMSFPRRLVYVVNRRTVVDQTTAEAEKLRRALDSTDPVMVQIRDLLASLCPQNPDTVLAISTLRGQHADNEEWRRDPARAAIILGTVDMIGSKLAFQGYGCGFKSRPLHAALLGQDVLILHDEAHLEPAFHTFVTTVKRLQVQEKLQFHLMALTACPLSLEGQTHTLSTEDFENPILAQRWLAQKQMKLEHLQTEDSKAIPRAVFAKALEYKDSQQAILIYLNTVDDVLSVQGDLLKENLRAQVLTGTLRGWERDLLAKQDPIFARFLIDSPVPEDQRQTGTVYLICTAAGEVGVNLSGEHLICDLVTLDRLLQRCGRVNRLGQGTAQLTVFYQDKRMDEAERKTLELLQKLPSTAEGLDASPKGFSDLLSALPDTERLAAYEQHGEIPVATDLEFDFWTQTTLRDMPVPKVDTFLHGSGNDSFSVAFAWREDVTVFDQLVPEEEGAAKKLWQHYSQEDFSKLLGSFKIKPHELLPDSNLSRVMGQLKAICKRCPPETPFWILRQNRMIEVYDLAYLATALTDNTKTKEHLTKLLFGSVVIFPPSLGGLCKEGFLQGKEVFHSKRLYDVSEQSPSGGVERLRRFCTSPEAQTKFEAETPEFRTVAAVPIPGGSCWLWRTKRLSRQAAPFQTLPFHQERVTSVLLSFLQRLGLSDDTLESRVLGYAAPRHDLGKDWPAWQRYIGNKEYTPPNSPNRDPKSVWAKPKNRADVGAPLSYRHEYNSLVAVADAPEFQRFTELERELSLQIIGSHHGRSRPSFTQKELPGVPTKEMPEFALAVPLRFATLQKHFGYWGLAYLESLLRIADGVASAEEDLDD